jgi:peptidoglycan/LPS O-acetylase OafA/YrhL
MEVVSSSRTDYRRDIDGLRALAILLVVAFHSGITFLKGGFIGVDVFFVISGFLIGGIIYSEMLVNKFSYKTFYVRRIKRIAPALIGMLVTCTLIAYFLLSPDEYRLFSIYSISTLASIPNIILWWKVDYFSATSDYNPLLMTWSLGVEEQFYIVFPILLAVIFKFRKHVVGLLICGVIFSFALSAIITKLYPLAAFYLLPTRAWEMGAGAVLGILYKQNKIPKISTWLKELIFVVGLLFIIYPALTFNKFTEFPGTAAIFPVVGSLLLILGNGRLSKLVFCNRLMVFIGLVSYSWYLWHWPLLSFARLSINGALPWHLGVLISLLALVISYLSYLFIETPFRRKSNVSHNKVIYGYIAITGVLFVPLFLLFLSSGAPYRVSPLVNQNESDKNIGVRDPCLMGYGVSKFNKSSQCIPQDKTQEGIAILGDSHAAALRGGIDQLAKDDALAVYQLTKASCPMLLGTSRVINSIPDHRSECSNYNAEALNYVINNKSIKTVLLAGYWDTGLLISAGGYARDGGSVGNKNDAEESFKVGLQGVINKLTENGKKVIVFNDVPVIRFDVIKKINIDQIPLRNSVNKLLEANVNDSDFTTSVVVKDNNIVEILRSMQGRDVTFYDMDKNLCDSNGCRFRMNGRAFYYDIQHLTALGGEYALKGLPIK